MIRDAESYPARSESSVTVRLAETLLAIARKVSRESDREALLRQADMLARGCREALPEKYDQEDVERRLHQVRELLERRPGTVAETAMPPSRQPVGQPG